MHFFLNECSFREQFFDRESLKNAVLQFMVLVERARRTLDKHGGRIWRSERLGDARAVKNEPLHRSLNNFGDQELHTNFRVAIYDMANPAPWEPERQHSGSDFYVWQNTPELANSESTTTEGEIVTDTSMAEFAERKLRDVELQGGLLNIDCALLNGKPSIQIIKEGSTRIALPSFCAEKEFADWLKQFEDVPPYASDATEPPRDEQTCLTNQALYEATKLVEDGRRVYLHRIRKQLYYVDNLHSGKIAHLEVFDKRGRHLGTASLDGQLIPNTKVPGRTIKT